MAVSSGVIGFVVWRWHYGHQFEANVVRHEAISGIDRLWFSGKDRVFAAKRTPSGLTVSQVAAPRGSSWAEQREPVLISHRGDAPYAVSPEGDSVVAAEGQLVTISSLFGEPPVQGKSSVSSEITHLAWIDGSVIIALHNDGMVEALDASTLETRATIDSKLDHPSALAANGTFAAIGSKDRRTIAEFDTRMLPQISLVDRQEVADPFAVLALTSSGEIIRSDGRGAVTGAGPLPSAGGAQLIDFFNGDALLVADSSKLRFVSSRLGSFDIPNVPAGITAIASSETRIAVASSAAVVLLQLRITPPIDEAGWSIVARWVAATAIVGIVCILRIYLRAGGMPQQDGQEHLAGAAHPN